MMTEDEAKTKWCPFARAPNYLGTVGSTANRNLHGHPLTSSFCVGSACMAWRLVREPDPADDHPFGDKFISVRGYCGAFGRPSN